MIIHYTTEPGQKLTEEQIKEIEEAKKYPIVYDEDCPPLSEAMIKVFECSLVNKNRRRNS